MSVPVGTGLVGSGPTPDGGVALLFLDGPALPLPAGWEATNHMVGKFPGVRVTDPARPGRSLFFILGCRRDPVEFELRLRVGEPVPVVVGGTPRE